jgi:hypothetical protein
VAQAGGFLFVSANDSSALLRHRGLNPSAKPVLSINVSTRLLASSTGYLATVANKVR